LALPLQGACLSVRTGRFRIFDRAGLLPVPLRGLRRLRVLECFDAGHARGFVVGVQPDQPGSQSSHHATS
jgi:hypothetical protein